MQENARKAAAVVNPPKQGVKVEIPDDFEKFRLIKKTIGLLWSETDDYIVLVQDYDVTNKGKGYRHNDFHIIPKGVIRSIRHLGEEKV